MNNKKEGFMYERTRSALLGFVCAYRRHTGSRVSETELLSDKERLREAMEDAIRRDVPELYRVAEHLALALRAEPLPRRARAA
ncbi:hypothetical protein [Alkalilimnicola sp. S0819]|uniref:hypothetical protein n=1 Tax=Alkalilimnicola sp. S0819 TaxID=2613922 RepID=UPI00126155B3|nr:hypothetical protein [Alkalilimnicola sp. S0819]KAB7628175.1 hypothetical protein F3N43_00225 [Alkalilimnicola sp. S0819]MPQ15062.1 hypothetical protein [Alkalilimnicola sp. S0819]